ncbi:MAG: PH domain-containing protein [Acidobacteria bacterium]|nr:PH domain-containing protein [Acidobacteriota bacterium]
MEAGVVRYRHGLMNQTTRALDLKKLQDVRVERSLTQRLWGVGTLVLETANESGRITVNDIDGAQRVADRIMTASRREGNTTNNV